MMRIDLFNRFEDIPLNKADWNELVQHNITNTIFQTYEWFHCWWRHYGKSYELIFLTASDDTGIIGFAPFMINRSQYGKRIVRFIGDSNSDYCDFVIKGNRLIAIDAFMSYLFSDFTAWTDIILLNIPDYSTTKACLQTICCHNHLNIQIKAPIAAPTLVIKGHPEDVRARTDKYSIRRHTRKLEKMGNLQFYNISDKKEILQHMQNFFDQHVKRYDLKGIRSQFRETENQQFFIDLVKDLNNTGWLLFSVLELDGHALAYHLGFEYNGKVIWYKPSFDIKYRNHSPGTVLLKELIEYSSNNSLNELDFSVGDESFKTRFSNLTRYNDNIAIYRSRLLLSIYILRQYLAYLVQGIRRLSRKSK